MPLETVGQSNTLQSVMPIATVENQPFDQLQINERYLPPCYNNNNQQTRSIQLCDRCNHNKSEGVKSSISTRQALGDVARQRQLETNVLKCFHHQYNPQNQTQQV